MPVIFSLYDPAQEIQGTLYLIFKMGEKTFQESRDAGGAFGKCQTIGRMPRQHLIVIAAGCPFYIFVVKETFKERLQESKEHSARIPSRISCTARIKKARKKIFRAFYIVSGSV